MGTGTTKYMFGLSMGDDAAVEKAFEDAAHVTKVTLTNTR